MMLCLADSMLVINQGGKDISRSPEKSKKKNNTRKQELTEE